MITDSQMRESISRDVDAEFISAARKWMPDALDRIEKLRELHRKELQLLPGMPHLP